MSGTNASGKKCPTGFARYSDWDMGQGTVPAERAFACTKCWGWHIEPVEIDPADLTDGAL